MDLPKLLGTLAAQWVEHSQRADPGLSLKTLGVRAADNSKLFERPDMRVGTYVRVLDFLADPANWPAALVPLDAVAILERFERPVAPEHQMRAPALAA